MGERSEAASGSPVHGLKPIVVSMLPVVTVLSAIPVLLTKQERFFGIVLLAQAVVCLWQAFHLKRPFDRWIGGLIFAVNVLLSALMLRQVNLSPVAILALLGLAILISSVGFFRRCLDRWPNLLCLILAQVVWAQLMPGLQP